MSGAAEVIHEQVDDVESALEERLEDLRERASELDREVRRVVREHPFLSLAGALGAGYLAGRLLRR